jgi:ATP-dependent RNA/DNA helicase IGHMBP2
MFNQRLKMSSSFKAHIEQWLNYLEDLVNCHDSKTRGDSVRGDEVKYLRQLQALSDILFAVPSNPELVLDLIGIYEIPEVSQQGRSIDNPETPPHSILFGVSYTNSGTDSATIGGTNVDNLYLVHGPPGTGKTTVIAAVVEKFLEKHPDARIIIASESHVAFHNALEKVAKRVKGKNIVNYDIWHDEMVELGKNHREEYREIMKSISVLGITCNHIKRFPFIAEMAPWDLVVIDEISKATFPEIMIPLIRAKKAILVGDPMQLPPVFCREEIEIAEEGDRLELIQRNGLVEKAFRNAPGSMKSFLNSQYRMTVEIGSMVSICFYDRMLHNGRNVSNSNSLQWLDYRSTRRFPKRPVEKGGILENEIEAQIIVEKLKELEHDCDENTSIAIITPYKAQKRLLLNKMREFRFKNIEIDTIDAFQGREAQIVFLSFTRNNGPSRFYSDPRRLNVAISRARDFLYLVGDSKYLSRVPSIQFVLKHCVVTMYRASYVSANKLIARVVSSNLIDPFQPEDNGVKGAPNKIVVMDFGYLVRSRCSMENAISWLGGVLEVGASWIQIDFMDLWELSPSWDEALNRLIFLVEKAKSGGGSIGLSPRSLLCILDKASNPESAIRGICRMLAAGPVQMQVEFKVLREFSSDYDEAMEHLRTISERALNGNGLLSLPLQALSQIVESSTNSEFAFRGICRILGMGPVQLQLDYEEVMRFSTNSDDAFRRVIALAQSTQIGGGFIRLTRQSFQSILDSFQNRDEAINAIGKILASGPVRLEVDYRGMLGRSIVGPDIFNELSLLDFEARHSLMDKMQTVGGELREMVEHEVSQIQKGLQINVSSKSIIEAVRDSLVLAHRRISSQPVGGLWLSSEVLNEIVDQTNNPEFAFRELGKALSLGPINVQVDFEEVRRRSKNTQAAVDSLIMLSSAAQHGGGMLHLSKKSFRELVADSASIDTAINLLGQILASGAIHIELEYEFILDHSNGTDEAFGRLFYLASQTRKSVFEAMRKENNELKQRINKHRRKDLRSPNRASMKQPRRTDESHINQRGKSVYQICQEALIQAQENFGLKNSALLEMSLESFDQILSTAYSPSQAVRYMTKLLECGRVVLPLSTELMRERSSSFDDALESIRSLSRAALLHPKQHQRLFDEYSANLALSMMLDSGYMVSELMGRSAQRSDEARD